MYEHVLDKSALISEFNVYEHRNREMSLYLLHVLIKAFIYMEMIECMFLGFEKNIFFSSCNCIVMYDPCNFAHLFPTMVKTVFYIYPMKVQMRSPSPFFANIHVWIKENYLIVSIVDH